MALTPNREVFVTCAVTGSGDTAGRSDKVPVTPEQIAAARGARDAAGVKVGLEVSGRVNLERAGVFAEAGAEFLSVGALTHSAAVWDVGLDEAS